MIIGREDRRSEKMSIIRDRYGNVNPFIVMLIAFVVVLGLTVFWVMFTTSIPAGHVGIQDTFGSVDDHVLQPGFHVKNPFTKIVPMSIQTTKYMDYGTNDVATITALSNEGLSVSMGVSVNYHINPDKAVELYKKVGENYEATVMVNPIHSVPRDLISKYDAKTLYSAVSAKTVDNTTVDRAVIEKELYSGISERINNMGVPGSIVVEDTFIRNIQLPAIVTTAIENVKKMEQESQMKDFEIQKQVKEAQRMREEAQGIADANRIISDL